MSNETTTVKGTWWRPEEPARKLNGEIIYGSTSGARIDLFGLFHEPLDESQPVQGFTLHGVTVDGKPISLFGCIVEEEVVTFASENVVGSSSCTVNSCSGIVGGHYESLDKVFFKKVFAKFTGLREWALTSGFKKTYGENLADFSVSYQLPPSVRLGQFDSISLAIEFNCSTQDGVNCFQAEQDCTLVLESQQMQPYPAFQKYIRAFQLFLCFPLQRPVYCSKVIGRADELKQMGSKTPIREDHLVIRKVAIEAWKNEELPACDQLFILEELKPSPAVIFKKFWERHGQLQPAMDLYFSTIYNSTQIPRVEFLTLAQGLEAYHRAAMPGKFTLQNRIKALAQKHTAILQHFLGEAEDFSKTISVLRNKLTHPSPSNSNDNDFTNLWNLSEQMSLLLEVCFLNEIGFSHDEIKRIIASRSERARHVHNKWVLV